jgi:hypothetical protein
MQYNDRGMRANSTIKILSVSVRSRDKTNNILHTCVVGSTPFPLSTIIHGRDTPSPQEPL